MLRMLLALSIAPVVSMAAGQVTPARAFDVSALTIGAPTSIVELDLSKLKGELRQVGWAPDGTKLYIQTADGNPQSPKLRHYWVALEGGAVLSVDAQPDWAQAYWAFK